MQEYEYRVMPAPRRGEKTKTAKTTPERFAHTLTVLMNDMARDGWEYQRADTLPCDERVGLTGKATTFQNLLIFRRALVEEEPEAEAPEPVPALAPPPRAPVTVKPAERVMAEYASLAPRTDRQSTDRQSTDRQSADRSNAARPILTADAPTGDAPRITLVASVPQGVPSVGPAAGNGLAKS